VQISLIPIIFGVGYATVYDLSLNLVGLLFAVCAVVFTALSQIFTNTYQKSLDCNALQLLHLTSPYIALGMLIMCPFFDDLSKFADFVYTPQCVTRIGEMVTIVVVQQLHMANVACFAYSCVVLLRIGSQYL